MTTGDIIPVTEYLYRRYFQPERKFVNPDGSATSRAFKLREKDKGKLSTNIKSLTNYEKSIVDNQEYILFEILVQKVVDIELTAIYEPLENNDAHSYIFGMNDDDDIKPGLLARQAKFVRPSSNK